MHGCGNDYVYVYTGTEKVADADKSELALMLSDRHKGIGSDGLIFINPAKDADFEMEMYNSDGTKGTMCGNGIRCVAKYVYDHRLTDKKELDILTGAGIKHIELKVDINSNEAIAAVVNMGNPILEASKIPVVMEGVGDDDRVVSETVDMNGKSYKITCVSMGNPHCVIFMDEDIQNLDMSVIGPVFEHHVIFPDRINAEFVNVIDRTHLAMRVWERGAGETQACGTGASATAVAAVLNGLTEREVDIKLLGGNLRIRWDEEDGNVYMTGPASTVYEGEVFPEKITRF